MQNGFNAYAAAAKTAQAVVSPRELEASLLIKAATRLQIVADDWEARKRDLEEALTYNRRLWMLLVSAVTAEDNPLPVGIKQNILALANFIFNQTIQISITPQAQSLGVLIGINRDIAAGLRGR
ncbi:MULTISPECIES: flagellar biosynthesis regulator FlaF [unclassified Bosea (in: a-proteobacteria)]|uniref:flagellar biosynthesis regulator FlaF n=1 Tax=unclassified Bosea (in: a-proteobacteria) TaxID=2653178 RepID=UPI0009543352|nr:MULTISPECIES: flagellar biosynthesis regulator FlaF [unclassified Bosea (in: a-proteobacteria)]TAJ30928.1 MAG: flagellar biosynthesis regulatory protein FlaF [Bosea sp. (in: a-proteobacteria)]SIQ23034.1 flagellar protein FlaF [Bosea sp. TND4EK4]